jgi:hypothetical protein
MGLHIPFEYLKHKLWPKERLGIKLPIWISKTKVRNRPNLLTCKWHATYHWKFFDKGYNFVLDVTSIGGLKKKLWASKVTKVPISKILGFSTSGSRDKMTFGCSPVANKKEYYKGEGGGFPQVRVMVILWIHVCPWFVCAPKVHKKCIKYALINLLFSLHTYVWIIDSLITHPSPHPGVPTCPFTFEVLRVKEHIPIISSCIVFTFGLAFESYEEFGGASHPHVYF